MKGVYIDDKTCILCGICEKACKYNSIKVNKDESTWNFDISSCTRCAACIIQCPKEALSFKEEGQILSKVKVEKKVRTKDLLKNRRLKKQGI